VYFSAKKHVGSHRGSAEISGSALSADRKGRSTTRGKKKNGKSKSKSGRGNSQSRVSGVGCVVRKGIFRGIASKKKMEKEKKNKAKDSTYITESDGSDALILSLAGFRESWVIDSGAYFHATS